MAERLRIEVLGPLRVRGGDGRDMTPVGGLQRRLLALLVLRRDHVVSSEAAIDALWPDDMPKDPGSALQNQVSRLRRHLGTDLIESVAGGYRLMSSAIDVDADTLAELVGAGLTINERDGLDGLLERWTGPAYPELEELDGGRAEAHRLEELRRRATEVQLEARIAAGDLATAIGELAALVDADPLQERPRALLMHALAGAGRRAEALRVYDDLRRRLGDELGIEPSPALAAQHADLLAAEGITAWTGRSRLPDPPTALLGREDLAVELTALLDTHRIVTLLGPGGVGKTRLAVEVGQRLRANLHDRPVIMCELATAVVPTAVDVVAAALRIDARPGVPFVDRICEVVGASEAVILLDNCEHVLGPIAELAEHLLDQCPRVVVIATSQERLRVRGEHICRVPTLPSEDEQGPAVDLFLERARAVAGELDPTAEDRTRIGTIVRRLDGLPLAIELAAARLHTHDLTEVAAGLDQRFALLSSGARTSARHGTLQAAVAWSVDLLDEALQRTFAQLSVFVGPFTADDAAAVVGADRTRTADALTQLCERSLVVRAPDRHYELLETLRAYGTEQLAAAGEYDAVAERHAHHQVDWAEIAERRMFETEERVIAEIDAAIPELRAALDWLLAHDQLDRASRLVVGLRDYGFLRGRPDVLAWSERVIAAGLAGDSALAARVWCASAYGAWMAGDLAATRARAQVALDITEATGAPMHPEVATTMASVALWEGDLETATEWYRRSADAARTIGDGAHRSTARSSELLARAYGGDPAVTALATEVLDEVGSAHTPHAAYAWYCAGESDVGVDPVRAHHRLTQAIALAERSGASLVAGLAGATRTSIDATSGDPQLAADEYRRLIAHWRAAGVWSTQWTMLRSIAGLLARLGRAEAAAVLEGAVRSRTVGNRLFGADEAALSELSDRLRTDVGEATYDRALHEGAQLDGDAAVEHALRSL